MGTWKASPAIVVILLFERLMYPILLQFLKSSDCTFVREFPDILKNPRDGNSVQMSGTAVIILSCEIIWPKYCVIGQMIQSRPYTITSNQVKHFKYYLILLLASYLQRILNGRTFRVAIYYLLHDGNLKSSAGFFMLMLLVS